MTLNPTQTTRKSESNEKSKPNSIPGREPVQAEVAETGPITIKSQTHHQVQATKGRTTTPTSNQLIEVATVKFEET